MYAENLHKCSFLPLRHYPIQYTRLQLIAVDGAVDFVDDPVHEMAPHVILLVVRSELFNVREAELVSKPMYVPLLSGAERFFIPIAEIF